MRHCMYDRGFFCVVVLKGGGKWCADASKLRSALQPQTHCMLYCQLWSQFQMKSLYYQCNIVGSILPCVTDWMFRQVCVSVSVFHYQQFLLHKCSVQVLQFLQFMSHCGLASLCHAMCASTLEYMALPSSYALRPIPVIICTINSSLYVQFPLRSTSS